MSEQIPGPAYPDYPASTPRQPARTSPWVWVAIGMSGFALLAVVVLAGVVAFLFSEDFGPGFAESEYVVTQSSVEEAVAQPCESMARAAADIRILGPRQDGAEDLRGFTLAAGTVVEAINDADPDRDSKAWRQDLNTLIEALDDFAVRLDSGDAEFTMPRTSDGAAISDRMYMGSPEGCEVPIVVEALDPDSAGEFYSVVE